MLAILPALALVQPYNLRGEDINVTIGPHPGGFPHHVENVTYDCRSEIELCRELFDAVEMGDRAAADERIRVALRDIYLMSDEEMRAKQEEMGLLAFAAMVAAWLRSALDDGDRVDAAIGALQAATDAEPGSVNTTALAAAIEQARAVEVPTEIINEAETVLKEAMKLQDRIVP